MIKVGVIGASGNMGSLACQWVEATDDLELVARITRHSSVADVAGADVAIDYTQPGVVMGHVQWCIEHGVHVVVGTSGFDQARLDLVADWLGDDPEVGVVVVPNFSIGAVLMMRLAAKAAGHFESVEIIELHHPGKLDAPSGTAVRTAQLVAAARAAAQSTPIPDATSDDALGSRGGVVEGVPVHSVRVRGLVAHQEVVFGNEGETLTIRHDMLDRATAQPGLLASVRYVVDHPGLTVGLEAVLGLDQ